MSAAELLLGRTEARAGQALYEWGPAETIRVLEASGQKEELRLETKIILPDRLHSRDAALDLLRHGVHIAKTPLERIALEYRRRSGLRIDHVDRLARLINLVRAGGPDFTRVGKLTSPCVSHSCQAWCNSDTSQAWAALIIASAVAMRA